MVAEKVAQSLARQRVAHRLRVVAHATLAHRLAVVEMRQRKMSREAEAKHRLLDWD